jgi:hypothetical protein
VHLIGSSFVFQLYNDVENFKFFILFIFSLLNLFLEFKSLLDELLKISIAWTILLNENLQKKSKKSK